MSGTDRKAMKSIYNMLNSIGEAPQNNPEEKAISIFEQIGMWLL